MGTTTSSPEDVPSIHKSYSRQYSKKDIGKKFGDLSVKCSAVILDNIKDASSAAGTYVPKVQDAAKTLGTPAAVVGGKLASVVLVSLLDILLQEEKIDMKQLLDRMKETMHDQLTEAEVDKVETTVEGVRRWVRVELQNRKKSTAERSAEDIWKEFDSEVDRLRKDIDLLMGQRFVTNKGLFVFLHAVPLHLALLWDLAHEDYRVTDWRQSAHYDDLKARASEYADHAESALKVLLQKREDMIENHRQFLGQGWRQYWEDKLTKQCGKWDHSLPPSTGDYENRREAVREKLRTDLGKPMEVAQYWRRIVENESIPRPNDGVDA